MKIKNVELDPARMEKCAEFFKILTHPVRIQIVELLVKGQKCVGDIQKTLRIAQPPTSHHLKLLTKVGVLNYKRSGKNTYYSLVPGILERVLKISEQIIR